MQRAVERRHSPHIPSMISPLSKRVWQCVRAVHWDQARWLDLWSEPFVCEEDNTWSMQAPFRQIESPLQPHWPPAGATRHTENHWPALALLYLCIGAVSSLTHVFLSPRGSRLWRCRDSTYETSSFGFLYPGLLLCSSSAVPVAAALDAAANQHQWTWHTFIEPP